jgi:hypothetical protein
MPELSIQINASSVAWYGAIVATIGAAVTLWNVWRDRAKIRVKISYALIPHSLMSRMRSGFSIVIYNFGRRKVVIDKVYLKFSDGESLIFLSDFNFVGGTSGLPRNLEEGESHTVIILAGKISQSLLQKKAYPVAAIFCDALGREYKVKTKQKFWETVFDSASKDDLG